MVARGNMMMLALLAAVLLFADGARAQRNLYSLQPAVDALHRREAEMWLETPRAFKQNNNYNNNDDRQQEVNRVWVNDDNPYENDSDDDEYLEERKRSMFRERGDATHQTAFRERKLTQPELAAQFLEAIDQQRSHDREVQYKEQLHRLWQKYQQQENDLEQALFENENRHQSANNNEANVPASFQYAHINSGGPRVADVDEYSSVADKRRLIMPWLPVRKRSGPMAKRSSSASSASPYARKEASNSGTDEKVAHDLQAIFNGPIGMKSKRSSGAEKPDTMSITTTTTTTTTTDKPLVEEKKSERARGEGGSKTSAQRQRDQDDNHDLDHDGYLEEYDHGHSRQHGRHDHEHDREHDHEHDHDHEDDEGDDAAHEHDEDEDQDSGESHSGEQDDRKKKRAAAAADERDERMKKRATASVTKRGNQEVLKEDQIIPGDLTDFKRKKSVEWSKYFGIDRRKKSTEWSTGDKPKTLEDYTPTHFRNHDQVVARPKLDVNEKKLDNMDQKLKTIEELIIDETMKYTGEHEGMTNPEDIQKLRDHVISRLATAYSLEKMRRALEKLKESVDLERRLGLNNVEGLRKVDTDDDDDTSSETLDKNKRVAIKKEKVEYDNNQHSPDAVSDHTPRSNTLKTGSADERYGRDEDSSNVAPEKKGAFMPMMTVQHDGHQHALPSLGRSYNKRMPFDSLTDQYLPIDEYANNAVDDECPLLDAMEKRCRAINLLSGDRHQLFLPLCGVHQLCYLCGTSQSACDYQYMAEASAVCGNGQDCHGAARTALLILRDTPGQQVGPRECARNSCLSRALVEIGVM